MAADNQKPQVLPGTVQSLPPVPEYPVLAPAVFHSLMHHLFLSFLFYHAVIHQIWLLLFLQAPHSVLSRRLFLASFLFALPQLPVFPHVPS